MTRNAWRWLVLTLPFGCEARDITVFEVSNGGDVAMAGSGRANSGGSADNVGGTDGNAAAGSNGGTDNSAGTDSSGGDGGDGGTSTSGTGGSAGSPGSAGGSSGGETTCASNRDCSPDALCEKTSCDAPTGSCAPRPPRAASDSDYAPVCGCDGVTYWNDVVRRKIGTALLQASPCGSTARACDFGPDCGLQFMSCSRLAARGQSCDPPGQGVCWVLPPTCPDPKNDPDVWQECRPPSPAGPPPCLDTCNAIRIEAAQQNPSDPKSMCPGP